MLRWFVLWNKSLCLALTPRRYQPDRLYRRYEGLVAALVARAEGQVILDIGAGKWSSYGAALGSRATIATVSSVEHDAGRVAPLAVHVEGAVTQDSGALAADCLLCGVGHAHESAS